VRAWFRDLEADDVAQQILAFFLQLTASAPCPYQKPRFD
jgi:hypothetical protein